MKSLTFVFFQEDQNSLRTCKSIKHMFKLLTEDVIVLICVMLEHAIKEYKQEKNIRIKFKDEQIKSKLNLALCIIYFTADSNQHRVMNCNKKYLRWIQIWTKEEDNTSTYEEDLQEIENRRYIFEHNERLCLWLKE